MKNNLNKWITIGGLLGAAATAVLIRQKTKSFKPDGIEPVKDFDLKKYLGQWHEIARFDYRFENNLEKVTANYSMNDDGSVKVLNRGFNTKKEKWQEATGVALPVGETGSAEFKVSFMPPFYSGYNVMVITPDYRHAMVCGENRSYLWILSRDREMPDFVLNPFLDFAREKGFEVDQLIWPATS